MLIDNKIDNILWTINIYFFFIFILGKQSSFYRTGNNFFFIYKNMLTKVEQPSLLKCVVLSRLSIFSFWVNIAKQI